MLVVDDSALTRKLLVKMLNVADDIEVIGTAPDGSFALSKVEALRPDVVTLDLQMPRMDGLTALKQLVERYRIPVVLVSAHSAKGAAITLEALSAGAVDFVTKPERILSGSLETIAAELVEKIRVASGVSVRKLQPALLETVPRRAARPGGTGMAEYAIVIGVSTGGPHALAQLLPQIRPDLGAGVLIVQHMPEGFTALLAQRLARISAIPVSEAVHGDPIVPGRALLAPGGKHLVVRRLGRTARVELTDAPPLHGMRPSADVLFRSASDVFGEKTIGIIMTGMGEDGAEGMRAIRAAGGHTIAQDQASSVVYGMPKAAVDRGVIEVELPLHEIGRHLNSLELASADSRASTAVRPGADVRKGGSER